MTHYEVLQVMSTASPEVIRMAYLALAKKYHPDIFQGDKAFAENKMKQVNEAYSVLSSPVLRAEYDRHLQRAKEYAQKNQQQTQQTSQPNKQPPSKKKPNVNAYLAIALFFVLIIGLILLDDADVSDKNSPDNQSNTASSTNIGTRPLPAAIIPISGEILSGVEPFNGSELTVTADKGSSYVVKLKNKFGIERLSFYVRAGETVTVVVPAEYLYVYFASGNVWYGKKLLFGDETYYSMDEDVLNFADYSWEYTLYPVSSGNFSETPISPDQFW